jgi:hypothetical protein
MHGQRGPKLYAFITSALDGDDRSTSCSDHPFPAEVPRYQTVQGNDRRYGVVTNTVPKPKLTCSYRESNPFRQTVASHSTELPRQRSIPGHAVRTCGRVGKLRALLTSAEDGRDRSAACLTSFLPGEKSAGTQCTGGKPRSRFHKNSSPNDNRTSLYLAA